MTVKWGSSTREFMETRTESRQKSLRVVASVSTHLGSNLYTSAGPSESGKLEQPSASEGVCSRKQGQT